MRMEFLSKRQGKGPLGRSRAISMVLIAIMMWPLLGAAAIETEAEHEHPISTQKGDRICFTVTDQNGDSAEGEIEITDRTGGDVEGTWETRDSDGKLIDSGTFSGSAPCCTLSGDFESTQGGGDGTFRMNLNNGNGRWANSTTGDSGKISDGENCKEESGCDGCSRYEWESDEFEGFI